MTGYSFDRWTVDAPLTGAAVDRSGRYAAFSGGDGAVRIVALRAAAAPRLPVLATHPGCGADLGRRLRGSRVSVRDRRRGRLSGPCRGWAATTGRAGARVAGSIGGASVRRAGGRRWTGGPAAGRRGRASRRPRAASQHGRGPCLRRRGRAVGRLALQRRHHLAVGWAAPSAKPASTAARISSSSWRRDGRYVVTATQEKTVHAWDLRTGDNASLGPCFNKVRGARLERGWAVAACLRQRYGECVAIPRWRGR